MIETEIIKRNFDRFAEYYDSYSSVQDHCGAKLADMLVYDEFKRIIDVGCGTGNYTHLLRNKFPNAAIKAVDISEKMVNVAKRKPGLQKMEIITADAETMVMEKDFDLITSNACFQWFEDLDAALLKYSGSLKAGGTLLFSAFGPETFRQLRDCLSKSYKRQVTISSGNFVSKDQTRKMLENHFGNVEVKEEKFNEIYASLWELLSTIKYTGTRGAGLNGEGFGKDRMKEMEKIYAAKFGRIEVTYQIYYCRTRKREPA